MSSKNKPTLVLVTGTRQAIDFFSVNFMETTVPYKNNDITIIDYSVDWSLESLFEILLEKSSFSEKDHIFLNCTVDTVAQIDTFLTGIHSNFSNHFKNIKFLFINLDFDDDWEEEEIDSIVEIAQFLELDTNMNDLFSVDELHRALQKNNSTQSSHDVFFEHLSKSNHLLSITIDNLIMMYERDYIPEELNELIKKNMSDLLRAINGYITGREQKK